MWHPPGPEVEALPRLCGADIEVGNFFVEPGRIGGSGAEASRRLLAEIDGLPRCIDGYAGYQGNTWQSSVYGGYREDVNRAACEPLNAGSTNPQDVGRRFLTSNGSCVYIDLDHLEACIPEVLSSFDHLAACHAMFRILREALHKANAFRPWSKRIQVLINNGDGQGSSWGSHLSFLIRRRTFENLFQRKPHYLQFLAAFQVSSVILTGQGKVGSENGRPPVDYQISQRADFFETLQGVQTTYNRPIVNSRDEALCGRWNSDPLAPTRLHVIFFDSALAHGSALFRVGLMQLVLTLIERGMVTPNLILDDPVEAVGLYSHDPSLRATASLASCRQVTALELQESFLKVVKDCAGTGVFDEVVPRAGEIIALWEDTLVKLAAGDLMSLAPRLDWVMKLLAIERAMEQRPALDWDSPEVKVLDHLYSSLDDDGLYWAYESSGFAERLVPQDRVNYFLKNPPEDTRAWTRAMLLRRADHATVAGVDWDLITFKLRGRHSWPTSRTLDLDNPLSFTRSQTQPLFDAADDMESLLDSLDNLSGGDVAAPKPFTTANVT